MLIVWTSWVWRWVSTAAEVVRPVRLSHVTFDYCFSVTFRNWQGIWALRYQLTLRNSRDTPTSVIVYKIGKGETDTWGGWKEGPPLNIFQSKYCSLGVTYIFFIFSNQKIFWLAFAFKLSKQQTTIAGLFMAKCWPNSHLTTDNYTTNDSIYL